MDKTVNRCDYIDLAKGVGILSVVWLHAAAGADFLDFPLSKSLYAWQMPLFFFISGVFFKMYASTNEAITKKFKSLVIPFIIFHIIPIILIPLLPVNSSFSWSMFWDFLLPGGECHNRPLWFVVCLINIFIVYYIINKIFKNRNLLILLISFLIGFISFFADNSHKLLPVMFDKSMCFLPFFCLGHYLSEKILNISFDNKKRIFFIATFCFFLTIFFSFLFKFDSFLFFYVSGLLGVITVICFSIVFQYIPVVSYFGRYSMVIYVSHNSITWYLSYFLFCFFESKWVASLLSFGIIIVLYIYAIPIAVNYFPFLFGLNEKPDK